MARAVRSSASPCTNLVKNADQMCLLNSMTTDLPNHPQATVQMHTEVFNSCVPSMGP